jgi:tetratricopeptide (TPR) repeat protein
VDDKPKPPIRRTARRWRVAAALTRDPSEAFDGLNVLREIPGDFGVALWQTVRDVELWASSEDRSALFSPGAGERRRTLLDSAEVPQELDAALGVLTGLVSFPGEASADAVTLACGRVARWAEVRGALATALAFAQAAYFVLPTQARLAYEAGRLAALRGDRVRADTWFRRTIGLARQEGDWNAFASAYAELGDLYAEEGDEPRARKAFVRAFRTARRQGIYPARGRALYGLGRLEYQAKRYAEAERLLRLAWRPLGNGHPLRPKVAYAVAELALRQGRHAEAHSALRRLVIACDSVADRLRMKALLALCASYAGDFAALGEWWAQAWAAAEQLGPGEPKLLALLDLSRAAGYAGNRAWAHMAAVTAVNTARELSADCYGEQAAQLRDAALGADDTPFRKLG